MFSSIEPERYFWGPALTDIGTGAVAVIAIVVAAVAIGGFSFFAPWIIVTPVAMFMAGFLRGPSFGNALPKAAAMNLPFVLVLLISFRSTTGLSTAATILATASTAVLCTVGGLSFRRHSQLWSQHGNAGVKRRVLLVFWFVASVVAALWTLLWLFAFVNCLIYERGMVSSVVRLLLAGFGGVLGERCLAAFR